MASRANEQDSPKKLEVVIVMKNRQMTMWIKQDKAKEIPREILQLDKSPPYKTKNYYLSHFLSFSGCQKTQQLNQMTQSSHPYMKADIGGCL